MTTRLDKRPEAVWLGTTHAFDMMHAGMVDGHIAASAHAPNFLSVRAMMQAAWKVSCTLRMPLQSAQQGEYFVGWVQGYTRRTGETSDETSNVPDTWEDEGGALAIPWFDA